MNVEDTWVVIRDLLKNSMENHIPKIPINKHNAKSSWINKKVIKLIRKKNKQYSNFLQTKEGHVYLTDKQKSNKSKNGLEYRKI